MRFILLAISFVAILNSGNVFAQPLSVSIEGIDGSINVVVNNSVSLYAVAEPDGNYTYSLSGSPTNHGLSFQNENAGDISGVPKATGTFTITVTVEDQSGNTASTSFTMNVTAEDKTPTFGSESVGAKSWIQNTAITAFTLPTATSGDGTLTYTIAPGLPTGVTKNASHRVSGTPKAAKAKTTYTWTAKDADGDTAVLKFTITVATDQRPTFSGNVSNQTYTQNNRITNLTLPVASGGNGTIIYTLSPSSLPDGLSRNGRVISGTPTKVFSTRTYTWKVADSDRNTADSDADTRTFTITVKSEPTITFSENSPFKISLGDEIEEITVDVRGGSPPYDTFSISGLPNGVQQKDYENDADGGDATISGTPKTAGTFTIIVTVRDGSVTKTGRLTIEVITPPDVTLSLSSSSISENGGTTTVTATLSKKTIVATAITVQSVSGAYTVGTDATITIAAGQTSNSTDTVTITAVDNTIDAPDKTVTVTATASGRGNVSGAPLTITDDEDAPTVTLSLSSSPISENGGTTTVTATLNHASSASTSVTVSTSPGANTKSSDFTQSGTTLTIAAGATTSSGTVTISAVDNNKDEEKKEVTVSATAQNSQGVAKNLFKKMLTITDDDPPPSVSINSPSVTEGDSGSKTLPFTVTLSAASGKQVTVKYADAGTGTATSGTDYRAITPGTLTFTKGQTSKNIDVSVIGDTVDEPNETVDIKLSSPTNATFAGGTTTLTRPGTITDDDSQPKVTLSLSSNSISENGGTTTVTATLNHASSASTSVTVSTSPGANTKSSDFTQSGTTLTIAAGATTSSGTVTISAVDNNKDELDKKVTVSATANNGQGITAPDNVMLPITDDDDEPSLSINSPSVTEGDSGSKTLQFTVTLSAASGKQVTVKYADAGTGTATSGTDYRAITAGTLTFTKGQTSKNIDVSVIGDTVDEPNETVDIKLSSPSNATIATGTGTGTGTITDDDEADLMPAFNPNTYTAQSYVQNRGIGIVTLPKATGGDGTLTYVLSPSLPAGLTYTQPSGTTNGGTLTGTPTSSAAVGTYTLTATDTDGDKATLTFTIKVTADRMPVFNPNTYTAQSYVQNRGIGTVTLPKATGGDGTLTYVLSPSLPAGLTYTQPSGTTNGGTLTGTPTSSAAVGTYTLTATDTDGDKATLTFTIKVAADRMPVFNPNTYTAQSYTQNSNIGTVTLPKATGGDGTLTYALSPNLPAELTYTRPSGTTNGGTLTGTPTSSAAVGTYTLTATDTDGDKATLTFTIKVTADRMPVFNPNTYTAQSYVQNRGIGTVTLPKATGGDGTLTYVLSPSLPAGLTYTQPSGTTNGGTLTGTPTSSAAVGTYTLTATDTDGDKATLTFTIKVAADRMPVFNPNTYTAQSYVQNRGIGTVTLPKATGGDGTLTYALSPNLPAGLTYTRPSGTTNGGTLTGTPTSSAAVGTYTLTATDTDGDKATLTFTIKVAADRMPVFNPNTYTAQTYRQNTQITSVELPKATGGDGTLTYSLGTTPALPTGLTYTAPTSSDDHGGTIAGTPTATKATTTYTLTATDTDGDKATLTFTITVSTDQMPTFGDATITDQTWTQNVDITTFTLPKATGGDGTLSYTLTGPGTATTLTLPAGVTYTAPTTSDMHGGTIAGTPTSSATAATYTLTATDSDGDKATLTFTITVDAITITFTHDDVVADSVKISWGEELPEIIVDVSGGSPPYDVLSINGLPEGKCESNINNVGLCKRKNEDEGDATISGTPTEPGIFTVIVTVQDGSVIKSRSFVIDVLGVLPIASKTFEKNKEIDTIYVAAKGGKPPYTYSRSSAPSGIAIDANSGRITGTPTQTGKFNFAVTVTDANGRTSRYPFTMLVYSKVLAEKFSPILILTEHPTKKDRIVLFPEPVEIMGAESVSNLWFQIKGEGRTIAKRYPVSGWNPDFLSYYQSRSNLVNFLENKFAFLPETFTYSGSRYVLSLHTGIISETETDNYEVTVHFEYPGDDKTSWNSTYKGSGSKSGANFNNTAYVNVFEKYDGQFVIQYYYFYPFNDWQNNHEGDWPHINVVVTSLDTMTARLSGIDYKFHGKGLYYDKIGNSRDFNPQTHFAPAEGGTHPVVYVGAGSHGGYPTGGNYPDPGGTFSIEGIDTKIGYDEDLTPYGIVLSTGINDVSFPDTIAQSYDLIHLPNPDRNQPNMGLSPEMSWLGTGARWGTLEVQSPDQYIPGIDANNSPQGPFYSGWRVVRSVSFSHSKVPYTQFQQFPIVQDVTWSGTIYLIGDIVVYPGATLTIEDGATVRAYPNRDIHAWHDTERVDIVNYGTIVANGSSGQRIVFNSQRSNPEPNDWHGITNHGNLTLRNVVIRDAVDSVRTRGSGTQTLANVQYFNMGTGSSIASSSASGLSRAMRGNREAVLEWWPADNPAIARYQYRQRAGISGTWSSWTDLARTGAAPYHHHVTGLTNGTEYIFQVRGVDSEGNSEVEISGSRAATPAAVPAKVSNLAVSAGNAQVTLNWTNPQDTTIAKYQYDIRRDSIWAGMTDIPGSDSTTTSYIVTGLGDSLYGFAVRAVNSVGAGPRTQPGSARPLLPPSPPARVGTTVGNGKVRIGWPAASDNGTPIQKYQYRLRTVASTWAESEWKDTDDRALRIYRYIITGLANNTRYYFQMRAVSSVGASAPSDSTWGTPKAVPEQVMNVVAVAGDGQVTLTWNAANDTTITKYQYRHRRNNIWSSATDIPGSNAATTSYTVTGLTNNTRYDFVLYAVNDIGVSWIPSKTIYATPTVAAGKPALELDIPDTFSVAQNYPNPFNPETIITYELPQSEHVKLVIYNVLGQEIRTLVNDLKPPGRYVVVWDSRDELGHPVSSGIYLYRMVAGDFVQIKKMLILK